jgi:AraC-like DNA-binding protein
VQTILIALFIYLLGYLGIQQQPVYLNMLDDVPVNLEAEMQKQTGSVSKEKYVKNKLDDELKETYKTKLINYLEKEKPYLQAKLCINDLSESLQIPKHFLSQIINDSLGHTFYSLINYYRVNEVKRRIIGDEQERFTLLAIAYDSGFNSKSGFNQNFKLETGMTPMEFKNKTKTSTTDN